MQTKHYDDYQYTNNQYDYNGTMSFHGGKLLRFINNPLLNLPAQIISEELDGDTVNFVYDASGKKISQKTVQESEVTEFFEYVDGINYKVI
ncbi:hypothetical protein FACS1894153_3590 [Bacteroidia bacterium]|nr:hypothetical protein FACS1894153_3590 [Bacteroidia bacterium]